MKVTIGFLSAGLALSSLACTKKKSKNADTQVPLNTSSINSTEIPPGTSPEAIKNSTVTVNNPVTGAESHVVLVNPFESASNNLHFTKAMNGKLPSPFLIKGEALSLSFDLNTSAIQKETNAVRPLLDVMLVLDTTSSMGVQLEAARKSFRKFQAALKTQGFDARYSLLTFEDKANPSTSFIDVDSFQARLAKVQLGDGEDVAEASLLALQNALSEGLSAKNMDSVPVVLLVTDAVGHNGDGTKDKRDCTLDKTIAAFASDYGKSVKFFFATPDFKAKDKGDCYAEATNAQFKRLFDKLSEQTPAVYRGQALTWPFQDSTLTTELPKLIVNQVKEITVSCPAKKYVLSEGGRVVSSADEKNWALNSQGNPAIGPIAQGAELEALFGKDLKMEITRCCDKTPDPRGSCKSEAVQTLEFQLAKG